MDIERRDKQPWLEDPNDLQQNSDALERLDISIVIVSWNVSELVVRCLQSLERSGVAITKICDGDRAASEPSRLIVEVIVVDSKSDDGTIEVLSSLSNIRLVRCAENVGYAKGNNIGAAIARGKYLLFLNPDTEIIGDAVTTLWKFMEANSGVGIVGPHLCQEDGEPHLLPLLFPTFVGTMFEASLLVGHTPSYLLERETVVAPQDGAIKVDWVLGAALMIPQWLMRDIGGFDEAFAMYSEDIDLCARVKARGLLVFVVGDSRIMHLGGQSSRQRPIARHLLFWQSHLRYFGKYKGTFTTAALRMVVAANYLAETLLCYVRLLADWRDKGRRQLVDLYRTTLRSIVFGTSRELLMITRTKCQDIPVLGLDGRQVDGRPKHADVCIAETSIVIDEPSGELSV